MVDPTFPKGIRAFTQRFGTEEACLRYIRLQRWGSEDGFECPKCKNTTCWDGKTRNRLVCTKCRYEVQITAGTAFHAQRKGLVLWFLAMYLVTSSKQGISAKELARQLNVSYPTAWAWLHKLRACMIDPNRKPLSGNVEVDETYIGGIAVGGQHGRSTIKKTAVACAVEKNGMECGRVRLAVIPNATKKKLKQFLDGTLKPETTVSTDGWRGYLGIDRSGYAHVRLMADKDNKAHVILPRVHRVFSLVKRWLLATHQGAVSRKHLNAYLEEYTFRFNRRKAHNISHSFQRLMEGCMRQKCRPYWQIVGRTSPNAPMRSPTDFYGLVSSSPLLK